MQHERLIVKMIRVMLFLNVWALCLYAVSSQPVSCTDEAQCSEGYYCEVDLHVCRECLSCQDLKREPPLTPKACITSVADCGACFKGLVVDRLGDVNAACMMSGSEETVSTPQHVWWLIGVGLLVFLALMVGIIAYVCLNPGIFENFKFGGNCQSGTVSTNIRTETRATAPEAPPPYTPPYNDVPYSSVRTTDSPCPPHHEAGDIPDVHVGEEGPFIKRTSPSWPQGERETAGSQAARVYNLPIYERQDLPPSPESPIVTELNDNLPIHDEETMESMWTPTGPSNGDINANVNETVSGSTDVASNTLPALLAAARDNSLVEHTPPKQMRFQPNSNHRNRDSNPGDNTQGNFSGSQNGVPYNFITQITNVVQFNRTS